MRRASTTWVAFAMLFGATGCARTHTPGGDAGVDASVEMGQLDLGDRGLDPARWPEPCETRDDCPEDPPDLACFSGICSPLFCDDGLCSQLYTSPGSWGENSVSSCLIKADGTTDIAPWNGEPCAVRRVEDGEVEGHGVPIELCLALGTDAAAAYEGTLDNGCVWSDGLPVTQRAEEVACPFFNDLNTLGEYRSFCGGTCGTWGCPDLTDSACIGRSDTRAFGVCTYNNNPCSLQNTAGLFNCSQFYLEPCHCMVLYPQNPNRERLAGWNVPGSLCRWYQEIYPDTVECRDEHFTVLPPERE